MRKKAAFGMISVFLTMCLLVGCSGNGQTGSQSSASESAEPETTAPSASAESTQDAASEDADTEQLTFGFSPVNMSNEFFQYIESTMRTLIEERGDILITLDPQQDAQKQISQIEDMIVQGVDLIFLCPYDSISIKPALIAAQEADVPIICFDNPVADTDLVASVVATDNYSAGKVVAEYLMEELDEGSDVGIVVSFVGEAAMLRTDGFVETVGDYFNIVGTFDGDGDTATSMLVAEDILQGNQNVKAIYCGNDPAAYGVIQAIEAAGKTGEVLVCGVDGAPDAKKLIKEGTMAGTGAQSPASIAEGSVMAGYEYLSGGEIEPVIAIPSFIINKDNVDEYGLDSWQ